MRTKSLLCAAALAAGVVTSMGQVFSQNIVGYANKTLSPGFVVLANPFNNGANTGDVVLPAADGSSVLKWNGVGFDTWNYDSGFGGWIDADFNPAVPTINPGTGFFYFAPNPMTVTFTGNVAGNAGAAVNNHINAGFQLLGSAVPFSGAVDSASLKLPVADGVSVLQWNGVGYNTANYDSSFGGWIDADFNNIAAPTIGIADGFFYFNPTAGADWYQTVPAN